MATGGLTRWFKEQWVDISRPKEGGGFEPCGRKDADEGKYPKCVPASRAAKMTEAEIKSAVSRKRRAESTERREGKKPINVKTKVEKKNVPTDPKLYAEVKAAAKRKFDVYPSAYANGWLVQEYKRRGGKYKTVAKGSVGLAKHLAGSPSDHDQSTHGRGNTADSSTDYRMQHRPSLRGEYGAPAHNLTDLYPEDVYSRKGVQYYGTGAGTTESFDPDAPELRGGGTVDIDREVWGQLIRMRGNPDAEVSIYRAVPLDGYDRIQRGDWVAITPEYAREHGESSLRGNFKIIEATVRAGDIFTSGDSWQEWGWDAEDTDEDWAGRVIAVAEESVSKHVEHDQKTHGRRRGSLEGKPFSTRLDVNLYEPDVPKTLYHAAPKSARQDILSNGLDPKDQTHNTGAGGGSFFRDEHLWDVGEDGEEFAYEYRPIGVYFFKTLEDAQRYAGTTSDVYRVDTDKMSGEIIRDPSSAGNWDYLEERDQTYVARYVEPEAIELVGSVQKHVEHDQSTHGRRKTAGSSKGPASAEDFQSVLARAHIRAAMEERPKALSKWQGPETFDERLTRCYELSWQTLNKIGGGGEGHQLVHGSIHGPGSPVGRIPHAWVELADGTIFDPVLDLWFSPDEWERGFSAEAAVKYDFDEYGRQSAANMNMGPWHDAPYGNDWYAERGSDA
jgi:hypothetical protein